MDPESYRHDVSAYERPGLPYRCGRAARWGRPCWQGPDLSGACQGAAECQPVLNERKRWECRRPKRAGGPCDHGPMPDGSCPNVQPPCRPRPTLRSLRRRLSLVALVVVIAGIAIGTTSIRPAESGIASMNPGPLSLAHGEFTRETGCVSCHAAHDTSSGNWFARLFTDSDVSGSCTECHAFGGPATSAHNRQQVASGVPTVGCGSCHSEHKGENVDISVVPDVTCSNCHAERITDFVRSHPPFDPRYPSAEPDIIRFDHAKHLKDYFVTPKWVERAPEFAAEAQAHCTACHRVDGATRKVEPGHFQEICAGCHLEQIRERSMLFAALAEPTVLGGFVVGLNIDEADEDEQATRRKELLTAMAESGPDALAEAIGEWRPDAPAAELFRGLGPQLASSVAKAWLEESEYEAEVESTLRRGTWRAGLDDEGLNSIRYHVGGHADSVVTAWVETAFRTARDDADEDRKALGTLALNALMDPDSGPGACGKCHRTAVLRSAGNPDAEGPAWGYRSVVRRPHTAYSHRPHVTLLGPDVACPECHVLDEQIDYSAYFEASESATFESNFSPIAKDTCEQCHRAGGVRVDCQLCHLYHRDPSFNSVIAQRQAGSK